MGQAQPKRGRRQTIPSQKIAKNAGSSIMNCEASRENSDAASWSRFVLSAFFAPLRFVWRPAFWLRLAALNPSEFSSGTHQSHNQTGDPTNRRDAKNAEKEGIFHSRVDRQRSRADSSSVLECLQCYLKKRRISGVFSPRSFAVQLCRRSRIFNKIFWLESICPLCVLRASRLCGLSGAPFWLRLCGAKSGAQTNRRDAKNAEKEGIFHGRVDKQRSRAEREFEASPSISLNESSYKPASLSALAKGPIRRFGAHPSTSTARAITARMAWLRIKPGLLVWFAGASLT